LLLLALACQAAVVAAAWVVVLLGGYVAGAWWEGAGRGWEVAYVLAGGCEVAAAVVGASAVGVSVAVGP
jgi:hypothetical protein